VFILINLKIKETQSAVQDTQESSSNNLPDRI